MRKPARNRLLLALILAMLAYGTWKDVTECGFWCGFWHGLTTPAAAQEIQVIDGDSVKTRAGVTWRLSTFDCPETFYARCESELARGNAATKRLRQLIDSAGKVELVADRKVDRYGRQLGHLYVDGKDVGEILVREGFCVPYTGRTKRRDWCADK